MPDPTISFSCPACGIRLTVPANLAGIKGPCPSCRVEIQAPEVTPESIGRLEIQSPRMHPIVTRAEPHEPLNHPRLAKNKINRDSLSDDENPVRGSTHESPRPATARSGYSRYFLPSLLLIFLVALACGAWSFFQKSRSRDLVKQTPTPKIEISPEQNQPLESVQDIDIPPPTSPPLPIDGFAQSLPSVIEAKTPPSVTMSAREVLDQFLTAKSLPERRSILETQTSESELANSCLAAPLPVATHIEIEIKETNSLEQVTNTYYGVDFSKENESSQTHTILVRARGKSDPMIIVDPVLDTVGGRLVD